MKSFKITSGIMDSLKNQDVKSSQTIIDKVNEIHGGVDSINQNNLKLVNQHLINHFNTIEQPNNPIVKIRNRSKTKIQSMLQSQMSNEIDQFQSSYQYSQILTEKDKEIVHYKNHVQQLTEELTKLTQLFETVKNENQNLKKQLEQFSNYNIIITNQQKQIQKLQNENSELENILKNTLLQQERQKFQLQSSKQSLIIRKNSSQNGQKLKLSEQHPLNSLNISNTRNDMTASIISCPETQLQKQNSLRINERIKTVSNSLPEQKYQSNETYYFKQENKENRKIKY